MYDVVRQQPSSKAAHTSVASAITDTMLLAANVDRLGGTITNESTAILYIKLGTGAAVTSYWKALGPTATVGPSVDLPLGYTGQVDGIWATANGFARVTELSE